MVLGPRGCERGELPAPRARGAHRTTWVESGLGVSGQNQSLGRWLNVKSEKVEKPIFQERFCPPLLVSEAVNNAPAGRAGGTPSEGPALPRPGPCAPPGGPRIDPKLAEDVTALNIY